MLRTKFQSTPIFALALVAVFYTFAAPAGAQGPPAPAPVAVKLLNGNVYSTQEAPAPTPALL